MRYVAIALTYPHSQGEVLRTWIADMPTTCSSFPQDSRAFEILQAAKGMQESLRRAFEGRDSQIDAVQLAIPQLFWQDAIYQDS